MTAAETPLWRQVLLSEQATIQDAAKSLDRSGQQIVLIVEADDRLIGTLTDGDIRRGLLRGLTLDSDVSSIVYREPLVVPPEIAMEIVLQLMQANRIHQLPIVDEHRRVVGLHRWDTLIAPQARTNIMVIMAGGRGTRLRPHTENCPKPLLPVAGKPMLEHIIERAKSQGFHHFVLAVHFLGHMIEEYFGTGERWNVHIEYLHEEKPLGTAGAIRLLDPRPSSPFLVSNGDVLTDINYAEVLDFHVRQHAAATMAVRQHEWQHPFGVVHTKGVDIVGFEEKPVSRTHVNAGIYVLEPAALSHLVLGDYCDMPTLFDRIRENAGKTIVYPMHEPWLDVGRADDLTRAQQLRGHG